MYVDWEYYKIFYYVAKYRNFTKAARVLGSNQPNITHTMNKLEDQLHCVLFIRSNRALNDHWGYCESDKNYKSAALVIKKLVECVSKGGNMILNVGPDARGNFPETASCASSFR